MVDKVVKENSDGSVTLKKLHLAMIGTVMALTGALMTTAVQLFPVFSHVNNVLIHETPQQKQERITTVVHSNMGPIMIAIQELKDDIRNLSERLDKHFTDPSIHHTELGRLDERLKALERKMVEK